MEYSQVGEEDKKIEGTEYVQFDAFFLRDINGDGYAEGVRGACREIGKEDTLYMELNVLTGGYLEDGKITINETNAQKEEKNYYLQTAIVKDNEIAKNCISDNAKEIEFNTVGEGTQKLLTGIVRSGDYSYQSKKAEAIGDDINKYSRINSITLTGTHVMQGEDGEEIRTPITKTVEFTVDWYGQIKTEIPRYVDNQANKYQEKNINEIIDEENQKINLEFAIKVQETENKLNLKKSYVEGKIPELNGYSAEKVEVLGDSVTYTYDEQTKIFTAQKEAVIDENGIITKKVNTGTNTNYERYNEYTLKITYPLEAYKTLGEDAIEYKIPIKAYYEGYNNTNEEFENPYKSNIAEDTFVITFRKLEGEIFRFDVEIGKYMWEPSKRYVVSKKNPLRMYNGVSQEERDDTYIVRWYGRTGTQGNTGKMVMREKTETGEQKSDVFVKKNSSEDSMEDVTRFIGIYFSDPTKLLGEEGEIKVYNDETDELIETFNKNNWNRYTETNPYKYKETVKHIRVETSDVNASSSLTVYNIKELDDNKIIDKYKTKEEFDDLIKIKSVLTGSIGEAYNSDMHLAEYEAPVSVAELNLNKTAISTMETEKNMKITIKTKTDQSANQEKWINGAFLLKLPESIVDIEINDVKINNNKVKIISYEQYEEEGQRYIKINTENEEEASYEITIDCNITPDPRIATKTIDVELYAHNEANQNYYYSANDIYDVNNNLNLTEKVHKTSISVSLIAPNSLITSQTASNYDENGSIAIAPQIAMVSKEQRKANITIELNNNYSSTISEVKILGKMPFKGNTYVINGKDMGSDFTTTMSDKGIILPDELKETSKIYYSEKENANNDITDVNNGWTEAPSNFANVKTFLIDLGEKRLSVGEKHQINYEINIPEGIAYNQKTYSHHAVYFSLDTENGKYRTQTEPNKIGFRIAKQYDLELTKYQKNASNTVSGATYMIKAEGEEEAKTRVTGEDGKLVLENLYVGETYIVKEIKSPQDYELNENEVKFTTREENGELIVVDLSSEESTKRRIEAVKEEGKDWKIVLDVEDEVRAKLKIVKQEKDREDVKIGGVRYKLIGKGIPEVGRMLTTNTNGEINLKGLYIGEEYTLEEVKAEGYYLASTIKFVITNENGNYKVNVKEGREAVKGVESLEQTNLTKENEIPVLNLNIENEKIPTYNLIINKLEKGKTVPVQGAKFRLYKEGKEYDAYETDEQGRIEINGLYQYNSQKPDYNQTYILKEIEAPLGYAKVEDITFYVENIEGVLTMQTESEEVKNITVEGENITITIEDSPTFKLTKKGEIKGSEEIKVLAGVKFAIYDYETGEPAKDNKGNIIGEGNWINGEYYYTVETDEKGEIVANLPDGIYKAVELETQEEYELATEEKERTYPFGIGKSREEVRKWQSVLGASVGGSNNDYITAIAETSDGGIVVGGCFWSDRIELENGQVLENKRFI